MTNYKNVSHEEICSEIPNAHLVKSQPLFALDNLKEEQGYITFEDIVTAVALFINRESNPALFEATKRVIECERVVTVFSSEYVK